MVFPSIWSVTDRRMPRSRSVPSPVSIFQRIRSVYLNLSVDSPEEAERVHELLADVGEVYMPMEETFFATRFSQLRDRFGVAWSIMHERPVE